MSLVASQITSSSIVVRNLAVGEAFDAEKRPESGIVNYYCIATYIPFETCRYCMG